MEAAPHLLRPLDPNILGKPFVQRVAEFLRRDPAFGVKNRQVPERMNPGIRAAGSGDCQTLPGQCKERLIYRLLYGQRILLKLKARIFRSVVSDTEQDPLHRDFHHTEAAMTAVT